MFKRMASTRELFLISLVLFVAACRQVNGLRPFMILLETVKFENNPEILEDTDFKLFDYNKHKALNGTTIFRKDPGDFNVSHWLTATRANGQLWQIYNISINVCQFLDRKLGIKNPVVGIVFNAIKSYIPDLPSKCPPQLNKRYSLVNFYLDEEMFPSFVPNLKFRTYFAFTRETDFLFKLYLTGKVESKSVLRNRNGLIG